MLKPLVGITTERWSSSLTQPNHNVQGVLTTYLDALSQAGGLPVLIPLSLDDDDLLALYARVQAVLLPGGGDLDPARYSAASHPRTAGIDHDRDRVELQLARQAVADRKPLFGICRGAQVFNVALGGTLYQDLPSERPGDVRHAHPFPEFPREHIAHPVSVEEESRLARLLGAPIVSVNSRHHQAVKDVAPGLSVAAHAPDGVIEALELPAHPFALAVQWHPENLQHRPEMRALFERFVEAARMADGG
jgi:putative glutamine amidotransferase